MKPIIAKAAAVAVEMANVSNEIAERVDLDAVDRFTLQFVELDLELSRLRLRDARGDDEIDHRLASDGRSSGFQFTSDDFAKLRQAQAADQHRRVA